ncbi:MAG: hypothetical protein CR217_09955 [Beijerinckiaceae bacterium]|nr:MAG: hypothetical protein CR217_09955 [Beijerinckiaceae bacterium]
MPPDEFVIAIKWQHAQAMIAWGWLMVSASSLPLPAHLPGGFVVPNLTGPNALLEARTKFVHEVVSSS